MDKLSTEDRLKALQDLSERSPIKPDKDPRSLISQMLVEYGLLIALISMILIILLGTAGEEVNQLWSKINSGISVENR